jgi:hypothetical protein
VKDSAARSQFDVPLALAGLDHHIVDPERTSYLDQLAARQQHGAGPVHLTSKLCLQTELEIGRPQHQFTVLAYEQNPPQSLGTRTGRNGAIDDLEASKQLLALRLDLQGLVV